MRGRPVQAAALALTAGLALPGISYAATIEVDILIDLRANDGRCSLREAFDSARLNLPSGPVAGECRAGAATGSDDVVLGAGTFDLALEGDIDVGSSGAVRVVGRGRTLTTIDANGVDRAFEVPAGGSLTVEDLTIRGGRAEVASSGGAISSFGALTVRRAGFADNRAGPGTTGGSSDGGPGGDGGAIWSGAGALTVLDSTFIANVAGDGGRGANGQGTAESGGEGGTGGAIAMAGGPATISGSVFSANRAGNGGAGGIDIFDTQGGNGGSGGSGGTVALFDDSAVTLENSTIVAGAPGAGGAAGEPLGGAGSAGAIGGVLGLIDIRNSTFAANQGGALFAATISGSVLTGPEPLCSVVTSDGPNVAFGDATCPQPLIVGDPGLGPLADNGGPSATMLPARGARAVDVLDPAICPARDQRGQPRPALVSCDAGAVELQPGRLAFTGALAFGPVGMGALASRTATLAHVGGDLPVSVAAGSLSGSQAGQFSIVSDGCATRTLAPRGSCAYGVAFSPTALGPQAASLTVTHSGAGSPRSLLLSGTGVRRGVRRLGVAPARFRAAGVGGPVIAQRRRPPIGTTVRFRVEEPVLVTFSVRRVVAGRRKARRCVAPRRAPSGRPCRRQIRVRGRFSVAGVPGDNSFRFSGRARRKKLKPGRYVLVATVPKPASGRAPRPALASFRVVR